MYTINPNTTNKPIISLNDTEVVPNFGFLLILFFLLSILKSGYINISNRLIYTNLHYYLIIPKCFIKNIAFITLVVPLTNL